MSSQLGHTRSDADRIRTLERQVELLRATLGGVVHCDSCPTCQSNAEQTMQLLSDEERAK